MTHDNLSVLIPCIWPIFTDFQNEALSSNLNISTKYQPVYQAFYGSKSKLTHRKLKTNPILEIKDRIFMLRSIKQRAFFTHSVV